MKHRLVVLGLVALVVALLLVGGCSSGSSTTKSEGETTGTAEASAPSTATVGYPANALKVTVASKTPTLPVDARITVRIADVTNPAAQTVFADKTIAPGGALPVDVWVDYDAKKVDQTHAYSIQVIVKNDAGAMLALTKVAYPVLTKGAKPGPVVVEVSAP